MPPSTEKIEQTIANLNACRGAPRQSASSSTSGGIGKNDDSAKARIARAGMPHFVSARPRIQS